MLYKRNKRQGLLSQTYCISKLYWFLALFLSCVCAYIHFFLQRSQPPKTIITESIDTYFQGTGAVIAAIILLVILIVEFISIIGKCEYYNTSFGLLERLGQRIYLYRYSDMTSISIKLNHAVDKGATQRKEYYDSSYRGSVVSISTVSGSNINLHFKNHSQSRKFCEVIREKMGESDKELTSLYQTSFISLPLLNASYIIFSCLLASSLVVFLIVPIHNSDIRQDSMCVYKTEDGKIAVSDNLKDLRRYLDTFPKGEYRQIVTEKYSKIWGGACENWLAILLEVKRLLKTLSRHF